MFASMQGRTAIVTGASRGIGRGIAARFAAAGMQVLVVARRLEDAQRTAKEIGGATSGFAADITDPEDTRGMATAALARYGAIDVLCANAGIFPRARIDEMTADDFDVMTSVNLKGTFLSVQACLDAMKAQRDGRIVIVGSITGTTGGYPGYAHYAASKAGVNGFIRSAALEYAREGITVNGVEPGYIAKQGGSLLSDPAKAARIARHIPIGELGRPEDIALAMRFLASPAARYITGQTLVVDGGSTLPESPFFAEQA